MVFKLVFVVVNGLFLFIEYPWFYMKDAIAAVQRKT